MPKILRVFDENRLWEDRIALIGSWCFLLYQKHFKVKNFPLRTQDIDFLIPFPYKGKREIDLINKLKEFGFILNFNPDGSHYLWSADLRIDFLAPEKGRGTEKALNIKQLSLRATPLRFLDILLKDQIIIKEENLKLLFLLLLIFVYINYS